MSCLFVFRWLVVGCCLLVVWLVGWSCGAVVVVPLIPVRVCSLPNVTVRSVSAYMPACTCKP